MSGSVRNEQEDKGVTKGQWVLTRMAMFIRQVYRGKEGQMPERAARAVLDVINVIKAFRPYLGFRVQGSGLQLVVITGN